MNGPSIHWKTVEERRRHHLSEAKLRLDLARSYVREAIYEATWDQVSSAAGHLAYCQAVKSEMRALNEYIRARRAYGQGHADRVIADDAESGDAQATLSALCT